MNFKKLVVKAVVVVLMLSACAAEAPSAYKGRLNVTYDTIRDPIYSNAFVEFYWTPKDEIHEACLKWGAKTISGQEGSFSGCARTRPGNNDICEIIMAKPLSFNDYLALSILGHEVYHCLGAKHK
jgi:hypothetical protein